MQHWNAGDAVALRGICNGRVWYAQAALVVKDDSEETVLLLIPGSQCMAREAYLQRTRGERPALRRWQEAKLANWTLKEFAWMWNRFLIFIEPGKHYALYYIWNHGSDRFVCYYVNFELPNRRSHCGFDTLDLDLDIVVNPDFTWQWKDEDEFHQAIRDGGMRDEWLKAIEEAKPEVLGRIEKCLYPLNGAWLDWRPDPTWQPPRLPEGWEKVD